jgi:regulatory protein
MAARRPRPPLTPASLNELALTYVGRFATTRAKLARYLRTKLRERGWDGAEEPTIDEIVDRCAKNGFVDDAAYALSKARSLIGRGYGTGRVRQKLRAAGIADDDAKPARNLADEEAVEAALCMARRKRIGPFATAVTDRASREKALATMVRAGHSFGLARAIVSLDAGAEPNLDQLREAARQIIG